MCFKTRRNSRYFKLFKLNFPRDGNLFLEIGVLQRQLWGYFANAKLIVEQISSLPTMFTKMS